MRWQNKCFVSIDALVLVITLAIFSAPNSNAVESPEEEATAKIYPPKPTVRTPAKRLDQRFTVKVQLKKGRMKYVIPFWLDPTEKTSMLDERQFKELGWLGKKPIFDDVSISGYSLPIKQFKNGNTEDAYMPKFFKSCCYGVIGKDILDQYRLIAYDYMPAAVEWFKLDSSVNPGEKPTMVIKKETYKWETVEKQIFKFKFVAPSRRAFITQKWNNIPANSRWSRIQGFDPQYLDQYLLERYLVGRVDQKLEMQFIVGKNEIEVVHEFAWKPREDAD